MIRSIDITRDALSVVLILLLMVAGSACQMQEGKKNTDNQEMDPSGISHPDWSRNAVIYEVNIRQYTPEGTFNAFEPHLPRLRQLGVDILWLMPVHPIGELNRKGSLGSYYSVKDYKAINPEFGTMEDLKSLVREAHEMGFHVILDWVANHTAWDHPWMQEHPEWYTRDSLGKVVSPFDWTDVAALDFDDKALWDEMVDAMRYWVVEADIDGYRCDVAGMVPTEFWNLARKELDRIKPVFMLAEAEVVEHHAAAFDMSYAWELHHIFNELAQGNKNANDLEEYFLRQDSVFPASAYRMTFITNHDENSWNGTVEERLGPAGPVMAVLSYTLPGMPLIYSGQEVGLNKRLAFFEKDEIDWQAGSATAAFYSELNGLKKNTQALWNGIYGGRMERVTTTHPEKVFAFTRTGADGLCVLVLANLSNEPVRVVPEGDLNLVGYTDLFTGEELYFGKERSLELSPWDYRVYVHPRF